MILTTIIGGGMLYYVAKNFVDVNIRLRPYSIAQAVAKAKQSIAEAKEQVHKRMVSESEWQEDRAKQKAQEVYDRMVAEIFEGATEEEKSVLLALFQKHMPSEQ